MTNEAAKIAGSIKIGEKEVFLHIVAQIIEVSISGIILRDFSRIGYLCVSDAKIKNP